MKPTQVLVSALAFSTFTAAWPWPSSIHDLKALAQDNGLYQKRQDNGGGNNNNNAPPPSSTAAPASSDAPQPSSSNSAPASSGSADPSSSGSDQPSSGSASVSGSGSAPPPDNANSTSASPSSQYTDPISAGAQPGGVNMILPNTQSTATQYYKVDQTVTWIWNYTSLSRPPQAIDILATVSGSAGSAAPSPFTLATNYSFAPTETFTWDTGAYANKTSNLPVGTYTLMIYDAGQPDGVSATASPGYLNAFNQFRFGMYTGQPATSLATPFQCATCNGAGTLMGKETVWIVLGTVSITVGSLMGFSWGWGVL